MNIYLTLWKESEPQRGRIQPLAIYKYRRQLEYLITDVTGSGKKYFACVLAIEALKTVHNIEIC